MTAELASIFDRAGAVGYLHALDLDSPENPREIALGADEPVVTASVFKIPVLLEVAAQAAEGRFSLNDRMRIGAEARVIGPTGLSVMVDDADVSIRDLAYLMMSISDNTATDVLLERVGLDAVNRRLRTLGLGQTVLIGGCREILASLIDDAGIGPDGALETVDADRLLATRCIRPEDTTRTTPRDMTALLRLIWTDRAAPAEACAEVRRIMALQVWPHRLRSGFPGVVRIAAKTGTLVVWRNEVGVVEHPDGARCAVSVFTRARTVESQQPSIDAAIGTAARMAIDRLLNGDGGPLDRTGRRSSP